MGSEGGLTLGQRLDRIESLLNRVVDDHERRLARLEADQCVDAERQGRLRQEVDGVTGRVNALAGANAVLSVVAGVLAAVFGK